jgi:hypothetical protein
MASKSMKLTAACVLAGGFFGWQAPAIAGSDSSADAWSGDYAAGSLPTGTFVFLQYAGYAHSNSYFDTNGNAVANSHANGFEEYSRIAYFTQLMGHPFIVQAELPFQTATNVNASNLPNNLVSGGLSDPVVHFTYYFASDSRNQRWLGFNNYFYLPFGSYDNQKALNVSTPHQFTYVPEIGYTEGLGKFSPSLKGLFFDFIGNVSIHSDGGNPVNVATIVPVPGVGSVPGTVSYDTLTQNTSYDVKAFLRYEPSPLSFVALGIEKSWGGEQIFTNGRFTSSFLPTPVGLQSSSLAEDNYLRGHLQFQLPVAQDVAIGADVFHDFTRVGGFSDDFGIELRLVKLFLPKSN